MGDDRLNHLGVLSIESRRAKTLDINEFLKLSASVTKTGELFLRYDRLNCYFSYCFFSPVHYKDLPVTPVRFSSPVYYKDLPVTLAILLCLRIVTCTPCGPTVAPAFKKS